MNKPRLGSGERFKKLKEKLASRGANNPGALASWIGREKYGSQKMSSLASAGKKHHK